jgi:hypothetical protein
MPAGFGSGMRRVCGGFGAVLMLSVAMMPVAGKAQKPTDSSVQSSPTTAPPKAAVVDGSVESSPVPGGTKTGVRGSIAPGTALPIKLSAGVDSGKVKNGATLQATLTSAVAVQLSGPQCVGTCSGLTVPADKMSSAGEIDLQVIKVGGYSVFCDTQTFKGKEGHKDVADSAPAKGTDATLAAGAALTFHVQPAPTMAPGK